MNKTNLLRHITLACYGALLTLLLFTTLNTELPAETSLALVLSIKLVPLLLVLPGVVLNYLKSYIWLCFIVLFYFTQATVNAWLSEGALADTTIAILTVVLFNTSMMYVRYARAEGGKL